LRQVRVAVVTPYFKEPLEKLRRCHESVLGQTHPCTHVLVADGHPREDVAGWGEHITLPVSHGDYGNTPRAIGGLSALSRGFDAVAYLDADCWYAPEHIATGLAMVKRGAVVVISSRHIVLPDGTRLVNLDDADVIDRRTADTNSYLLTSAAGALAAVWATMPRGLAGNGDRVLFRAIRHFRYVYGFTGKRTVFYESRWQKHYQAAGVPAPPDAQVSDPGRGQEGYRRGDAILRLGFDPFPEW
jgi:glycosyltransferase involved in cell wall biosynthesis